MTIVAITGHRAGDADPRDYTYVHTQLSHAYHDLRADTVIQGMCDGVDLVAAKRAYIDKIPYVAVRPWATHSVQELWQRDYDLALKYASHVEVINESEIYPGPQVYHARNRWMVDRAGVVVAVWNGSKTGGTYATVQYAQKKQRPIWRIDPVRMEVGWLK